MKASALSLTAGITSMMLASSLCPCHSFHHLALSSLAPTTPSALSSTAASADINVITNNAVVGEADRSFRQGLQYEKIGLFRAAAESFHEAATLYQCFLDQITDVEADASDASSGSSSSSGIRGSCIRGSSSIAAVAEVASAVSERK